MPPSERPFSDQLAHLDHRSRSMWLLNGLLLVAMASAVVLLYLQQLWGSTGEGLPAPETRGMLATALCGLVLLFTLYVILKQKELSSLRSALIHARFKEEVLRSRLSEISSLFDIAASLNMQITTDAILDIISRRVLTCLEADQSSIFLLSPETMTLECRAVHGIDADFVRGSSIQIGEGIAGWVAQNGEPLVLNPEDIAKRFANCKKSGRNITSALCIPMKLKDRTFGILNINRIDRDRTFGPADARILTVFAEHAALAIQKVEEFRALDDRASLLEEANRRLAEVGRMKEIFLATVSHELKTPLTCIIAYAEFLLQDETALEPERRKSFSRILYDQATRLLDLVNDIMDLSRLEGGALKLNLRPTAVNDVVETTIQAVENEAVRKGIEIGHRLTPGLPEIPLDASKLRQVVMNLVNNAIKFTESGGRIEIATRLDGGSVIVTVSDTGIGIPAKDLMRVFELFTRSDAAVSRHYEGLGLGLHLVKRLVELHGGRVWVESTPGKGSNFSFGLPTGQAVLTTQPSEAQPAPTTVPTPAPEPAPAAMAHATSVGATVETSRQDEKAA